GKQVPVEADLWKWEDYFDGIVSITGNGNSATLRGLQEGESGGVVTEIGSGIKELFRILVNADTSTYQAHYWVPGTITSNTMVLKLHFENGLINGSAKIRYMEDSLAKVTGTL